MRELSADNVVTYLFDCGHLDPAVAADAQWLEWGVSNVVLRVHPKCGPDLVVKQSRQQLRTQSDWFCRLDRIWREVDVMNVLADLLPDGVVPRVLFEDRDNFVFGMEAVDSDHTVWKAKLLEGHADSTIAARLGDVLATIHRQSWNNHELRELFSDREVFRQLRVDPFYRTIAEVHPQIGPHVHRMIAETEQLASCLVLGDFSPKNVLLWNGQLTLVDFETGHFGDPAFDTGFFLSHLLLKTALHAQHRSEFLLLAKTFWTHYVDGLRCPELAATCPIDEIECRTIGHLAGCMLARIDGTSPIDYLPNAREQDLVRSFSCSLFLQPPDGIDATLDRWDQLLA
jgi:5-methylthioribose kinase